MSRDAMLSIGLDEIVIGSGRRDVVADTVKRLAASIKEIGLQHPITVRSVKGTFQLVAGRHRLEAMRQIGAEYIPAVVMKGDDVDARLWEIAENLHRAELSVQERADQIAEWVRLTDEKRVSAQLAPKPLGGRPESGINAASRDLGIERTEVQRAVKIASITPEAREVVREGGLSNNQSALLKIAASNDQVGTAREIATPRPLSDAETVEKQVARIIAAWNAAGPEARRLAYEQIEPDFAVMDRRFGS